MPEATRFFEPGESGMGNRLTLALSPTDSLFPIPHSPLTCENRAPEAGTPLPRNAECLP